MKYPEIDNRSKDEIIQNIKSKAIGFAPEWKFDEENPDVGTALSMIYADMFSLNVEKLNKISLKNMIGFFNELDAELLPSYPSNGYIKFGISSNIEQGARVYKGTTLLSQTEDKEEPQTVFQTMNDVLVTYAQPEHIFCVNGEHDYIQKIANLKEDNITENNVYLFNLDKQNLQEHILYISHTDGFDIKNRTWIYFDFSPYFENKLSTEVLEKFCEEKYAIWEYQTEDGFEKFEYVKCEDGKILLIKGENTKQFGISKIFENESRFIRCRIYDINEFENLIMQKISIKTRGVAILPDVISDGGIDKNIYECFAFGEKFTVFSDVYFASQEVLTKKGANVELSFNLSFAKVPLDIEIDEPNVNWKLIMKKSEFKPDVEYDVTIDEVIWEYYNGKGWARLFKNNEYNDVFTTKHGTMGQYRTINFMCPEDIDTILVNSTDAPCIRAQIIKVNNAFKIKGNYISPVIENTLFKYEYIKNEIIPQKLDILNNLEHKQIDRQQILDESVSISLFNRPQIKETCVYLSFDEKLTDGPIRILFSLFDVVKEKLPRLTFEYFGKNGFAQMNVFDDTLNFAKSGILTFVAPKDFTKTTIFGKEGYYIRIVDVTNHYGNKEKVSQMPLLTGVHINVTEITNTQKREVELFDIEPFDKNHVCHLLYNKVQKVVVEVLENDEWIIWEEVSDFASSEPTSRHYRVDRIYGNIIFSDDKNGMIPKASDFESIRVHYTTGGGTLGNVPANAIGQMNISVDFVSEISNPYDTTGGTDVETIRESIIRNAHAIRHGYRAVTARDYENLAKSANRNINRVKCFTGRTHSGARQGGDITLVILLKDLSGGNRAFEVVHNDVLDFLSDKIPENILRLGKFHIVQPKFLELSVKVEVVVANFGDIFEASEKAEQALEKFINPITGNFNERGWNIGQIPNRTQIINCLKDVESIKFIKNIFVSAYTEGKFGKTEVDFDNLADKNFILPVSGKHEIIITVEER